MLNRTHGVEPSDNGTNTYVPDPFYPVITLTNTGRDTVFCGKDNCSRCKDKDKLISELQRQIRSLEFQARRIRR